MVFFLVSQTTVNKIISKNLRLLSFTIIVICFTINTTNWYVFIRTNYWTFSIGSQCNTTKRINDKFMYTCTDTYYNASFFLQYLITLYDIFVTKAIPSNDIYLKSFTVFIQSLISFRSYKIPPKNRNIFQNSFHKVYYIKSAFHLP